MTYVSELRKKWMKDPEFRAEYEAQRPVFELMMALAEARLNARLTQEQLANRMETTQSAVARLEGWTTNPSVNTLRRFAEATGTRLKISFEPIGADRSNADKDETFSDDVASEESVETRIVEPAPVST